MHEVTANTSCVVAGNLNDLDAGSGKWICRWHCHWCRLGLQGNVVGDDENPGPVDFPWARTCHSVIGAKDPKTEATAPTCHPWIANPWPPVAVWVMALDIESMNRKTVIGPSPKQAWACWVLHCQWSHIITPPQNFPVTIPLSGRSLKVECEAMLDAIK